MSPKPPLPEWQDWDLSFTAHVELRMEQRGVTEVDVRAMLEGVTQYDPSVVTGRFMLRASHKRRAWTVVVEPDPDVRQLVVVTVYETSDD